ncbi:MAG TPA: alpha/beta fold hydrolase [Anaerolineae bacterium]|nr:alpha/beta fold hydrolase [Anaerolineae bacterium]
MNSTLATPIDREVTFQSGNFRLAGSLMLPNSEGQFPAVLLLPGSGEVDRNENHKKLPLNALREIAEYLAAQGIASFRFDKRGVGASEGQHMGTGFCDHINDAAAALAWLKVQPQIQTDKVFVLGHSEGSALTTRLAGMGADIAGIILLTGWAKNSEELLYWQAEQVVPTMGGLNGWLIKTLHIDIRKSQAKQFAKIKRSNKDWYRQLNVKVNAKWLREFLTYTPADDLVNIHVPVLAITGSKDIQVDPAEVAQIELLVPGGFEGHVVPDVTHVLRADMTSGRPSRKTYPEQIKRPVDGRILDLVGAWLKKQIAKLS